MADTAVTTASTSNLMNGFTNFWASLAGSASALAATQARVRQMEALSAKSDAQLADMGLRRDDIARYVFREYYYV